MAKADETAHHPGIYHIFSEEVQPWVRALYKLPLPIVVADDDSEIVLFTPEMQALMALSPERVPEIEPWEIYRTYETHGVKKTIAERTRDRGEPMRGIETELLNPRGRETRRGDFEHADVQ